VTASAPSRNARQATLLVAFMWVAYFLNYADRQAVFAMFPALGQISHDRQTTRSRRRGFLWVYAFGCPVAGQLSDRFSKRLLVVLSPSWSIVTVATGFDLGDAVALAAMGI
jgi:MFS family permease